MTKWRERQRGFAGAFRDPIGRPWHSYYCRGGSWGESGEWRERVEATEVEDRVSLRKTENKQARAHLQPHLVVLSKDAMEICSSNRKTISWGGHDHNKHSEPDLGT